ncbi:PTS system ascorbate-specific IIB component [Klebsiella pneumoniae MGH 47]|nr:PTS system ascorbate-specific IIB component [Klebsiella pneumoniae MGH 47]
MLKILCVCGCGLGSSFAIEMTAKAVLKKLEIPAHIEHTTVSEAGAFKSDMILTQKTFADILTADAREGANKQVISSQADSLIKISRIWADFFPANTSNQPI